MVHFQNKLHVICFICKLLFKCNVVIEWRVSCFMARRRLNSRRFCESVDIVANCRFRHPLNNACDNITSRRAPGAPPSPPARARPVPLTISTTRFPSRIPPRYCYIPLLSNANLHSLLTCLISFTITIQTFQIVSFWTTSVQEGFSSKAFLFHIHWRF